MTAEHAVNILIKRNQAFVNKQGKSTEYSRESDEIVNALLKAIRELKVLRDCMTKLSNLAQIGGLESLPVCLRELPDDFIDLCWSKRFEEYQDEKGTWHKFSTDPKQLYPQLLESYRLHQQSLWNIEQDIEGEWELIREDENHEEWTPEQREEIADLHYQMIKSLEEEKMRLFFHS